MEAVRFENITKSFGPVKANNGVTFTIEKGLIYSILGENGSGKTSLMNVIAGIYQQEEGKIFIGGEEASITSPRDAFAYHIGMIHQHFKLVDKFTAVENIVLGLTKEDYKLYSQEQKEKLIEKEQQYGTKKDIKSNIKALKKKIAHCDDTEELTALNDLLSRAEKNLKTINNYRRYERRSHGFDINGATERVENICAKYGFKIDPNKHVHDMSVSEKQELEIVKVLYRGVDILILDEPTAVLTPQETAQLFTALRNMKNMGKTVIIITHKLNEVLEISDKVVVLRKGEYIGEIDTKYANEQILTEMMVGKKVELNINRSTPKNVEDRLEIKDLSVMDDDHKLILDNISFTIRSGEILGIAGIAGNGQKQLLESISGLLPLTSGDLIFHNPKKNKPVTLFHKTIEQVKFLAEQGAFHYPDGRPVDDLKKYKNKEIEQMINDEQIIFNEDEIINLKDKNPLQIRELGIRLSFVPEDRLGMGLVGSMDLTDNMMLRSYRKGSGILVNRKNPSELAKEVVKNLEVSTPSIKTPVKQLSGGNIQKVLVGREISFAPKVLMTAYPVRGLDINSSYVIYNLLDEQKRNGVAVVYVGEDLDVLMALCDRLLVLSNGKISGIVDPKTTTKDEIGILMTKEVEYICK